MKILKFFILSLFLILLVACEKKHIENINIYTDPDLEFLVNDIATSYEKKESVKINISTTLENNNLNNLDIIISNNEDIFKLSTLDKENTKKTENIDLIENYEKEDFLEDKIIIIGRRKLSNLDDLLYSSIAISNYDTFIGKNIIDILSMENLFNQISKKIEYKNNSISALQSVDLYEVDYAIIGKILSSKIKNSTITYYLPEDLKITYNSYLKKDSNINKTNFYSFLQSEQVKKIISKHQEIN